jgi:hypothetical protein
MAVRERSFEGGCHPWVAVVRGQSFEGGGHLSSVCLQSLGFNP